MSVKSQLRSIVPPSLWQTIGFCGRLPTYWKFHRSESLRVRKGIEGLPLYTTPDVFVQIPESVTACMNWRSHGIEDPTSSVETRDFLDLARGRSHFIDIGAQTGFMSALFAMSRNEPMNILSVEPDPRVHDVLARARELNLSRNIDWTVHHAAVSDADGSIFMPVSNTLYEARNGKDDVGKLIEVDSVSLASLVTELVWIPDLIKIDVESFEYEILTSSTDLVEKLKPAIQLEVHWELLKSRGLDALQFLGPLAEMGYRGQAGKYSGLAEWSRAGRTEPVSRLSLQVR